MWYLTAVDFGGFLEGMARERDVKAGYLAVAAGKSEAGNPSLGAVVSNL